MDPPLRSVYHNKLHPTLCFYSSPLERGTHLDMLADKFFGGGGMNECIFLINAGQLLFWRRKCKQYSILIDTSSRRFPHCTQRGIKRLPRILVPDTSGGFS
jgi:hypothetical protein